MSQTSQHSELLVIRNTYYKDIFELSKVDCNKQSYIIITNQNKFPYKLWYRNV